MITINFTGGVRKSFDTDKIILDKDNITVNQLIEYLIDSKPKNTASFDGKNLLIAINEIDSSALNGYDTVIKQNDVVNIIPIIHGGAYSRLQMKILSKNVEIYEMKKSFIFDNNSHESTGGQPTVSSSLNIPKILNGCNYKDVSYIQSEIDLINTLNKNKKGLVGLVIQTKKTSRPNLGRPADSPKKTKVRFMESFKDER